VKEKPMRPLCAVTRKGKRTMIYHNLDDMLDRIRKMRDLSGDMMFALHNIYDAETVRITGTDENVDAMLHTISQLIDRWWALQNN